MFDHKVWGGKTCLCYDQLYHHNDSEFIAPMCKSVMFNFIESLFQSLHVVLFLVSTILRLKIILYDLFYYTITFWTKTLGIDMVFHIVLQKQC
jgi:hypothetical protein